MGCLFYPLQTQSSRILYISDIGFLIFTIVSSPFCLYFSIIVSVVINSPRRFRTQGKLTCKINFSLMDNNTAWRRSSLLATPSQNKLQLPLRLNKAVPHPSGNNLPIGPESRLRLSFTSSVRSSAQGEGSEINPSSITSFRGNGENSALLFPIRPGLDKIKSDPSTKPIKYRASVAVPEIHVKVASPRLDLHTRPETIPVYHKNPIVFKRI